MTIFKEDYSDYHDIVSRKKDYEYAQFLKRKELINEEQCKTLATIRTLSEPFYKKYGDNSLD